MYVTLRRGDHLPTVALAQARLLERGAPTDLVVDGLFGEQTERAVENFQLRAGIPRTKFVDPQTWSALCSSHSMSVIDAIDATDITVLQQDSPFLADGHSQVVVSYGMSRGARDLIQRLVASNPPQSVALLRLHGHGSPGAMVVSSGRHAYGNTSVIAEHFVNPEAVAQYAMLGTIMKPYGSIELHGCRVALRTNGRRLLEGLSQTCRVPVTAGIHYQMGAEHASRFEGPVLTRFPLESDIVSWASRVFNHCQW